MSTIQIRDVPADLHRRLKARAAMAGLSLSDYLLRAMRELVERPALEEMRIRLAARTSVPGIDAVQEVRVLRDCP